MKKTHWLRNTLITLLACGVIGLILAVVLFNADPGRTSAEATVEFAFDGAADGIAPNGYRYDLSGFTSDEVLSAALKDAGLDGKYSVEQIKANILVSGVYPKNIVEQMTKYESLLTGDASKVKAVDYHATLYKVVLYNDFDKSIAPADLEKLLSAIMSQFRTQFEKTYSVVLAKDSFLEYLADYDYSQQLAILEGTANRYAEYVSLLARDHADFLLDGESFTDIAAKYENLISSDLQRLSGLVTMNALSKDQDRIVAQYENEIKILQIRLKELTQEAKDTESLINQYSKDDIIYVSTAEALQQVSGNSTQTYDTLITRRRAIEENIAELNKELAETQLKLSDITGKMQAAAEGSEEGTSEAIVVSEEDREAQKVVVENGIDAAVAKLNKITEDFSAFLKAYSEREMNDSTVAITAVKYKAPKILSGTFAVHAIKVAGPICVLGFIACLICLIVSRSKEGKRA